PRAAGRGTPRARAPARRSRGARPPARGSRRARRRTRVPSRAPPEPRGGGSAGDEGDMERGAGLAAPQGGCGVSYDVLDQVFACCRHSDSPPPARFVFAVLAHCRNTKTGRCDPSIATLSAVTGYGRATVLRALDDLKRCGAVTITRRRRRS